ncbi:peroxisome biogenesis protein [Saccharomyces eubayanus]|uniref:peroxisome biogenesis protein n=1 Tax=Saccharomyces eubayanus TaxID=1080349 RepID=UPI0006C2B354|nr:PEX32-like protein [Saccharomyces eubayanus]KOG98002.1 PEX32-like protein [Saccharomyces eubayanus]
MSDNTTNVHETRAKFAETLQPRIGGNTTKVIRAALDKNDAESGVSNDNDDGSLEKVNVATSPLLTSTPPTISKALVRLYPYLIIIDDILDVITWTGTNIWSSILMLCLFAGMVLYFETLVKYFGHLAIIAILWGYSLLDNHIEGTLSSSPTLEDIASLMNRVSLKSDILLSPMVNLGTQDIQRLLYTTVILSPIYVMITWLLLPPRSLMLIMGLFLLSYHSPWSKVARRLLWKFKVIRLLVFYVTGLDLGGINKDQGIFATVQKQVKKLASTENANGVLSNSKPIRFTYVLYENQRRWLGIGWKPSMLSYERTPWTDEFLNEAPSPENFHLPEETSSMVWRWVDKTWRLDMTNDGAIQVPNSKARTAAEPSPDEGFIYYDNTWKKPSKEDSFSKYTRRRRWVRTAELIKASDFDEKVKNSNRNSVIEQKSEDSGDSLTAEQELENSKKEKEHTRKVGEPTTEETKEFAEATSVSEREFEKISSKEEEKLKMRARDRLAKVLDDNEEKEQPSGRDSKKVV